MEGGEEASPHAEKQRRPKRRSSALNCENKQNALLRCPSVVRLPLQMTSPSLQKGRLSLCEGRRGGISSAKKGVGDSKRRSSKDVKDGPGPVWTGQTGPGFGFGLVDQSAAL